MSSSDLEKVPQSCGVEEGLDRRSSEESAAGIYHVSAFLQVVQAPDHPADGQTGEAFWAGESRWNEPLARWMQGWMAGLSGEEAGKAGRGQTRRFGSQRKNLTLPLKGSVFHLERALWTLRGGQLGQVRQGVG